MPVMSTPSTDTDFVISASVVWTSVVSGSSTPAFFDDFTINTITVIRISRITPTMAIFW